MQWRGVTLWKKGEKDKTKKKKKKPGYFFLRKSWSSVDVPVSSRSFFVTISY